MAKIKWVSCDACGATGERYIGDGWTGRDCWSCIGWGSRLSIDEIEYLVYLAPTAYTPVYLDDKCRFHKIPDEAWRKTV